MMIHQGADGWMDGWMDGMGVIMDVRICAKEDFGRTSATSVRVRFNGGSQSKSLLTTGKIKISPPTNWWKTISTSYRLQSGRSTSTKQIMKEGWVTRKGPPVQKAWLPKSQGSGDHCVPVLAQQSVFHHHMAVSILLCHGKVLTKDFNGKMGSVKVDEHVRGGGGGGGRGRGQPRDNGKVGVLAVVLANDVRKGVKIRHVTQNIQVTGSRYINAKGNCPRQDGCVCFQPGGQLQNGQIFVGQSLPVVAIL
eukprot:scaffold8005_cov275-Amphora_coffeaeformis.AAC.37